MQERIKVLIWFILELKSICNEIVYYNHILEEGIIEYVRRAKIIVNKYKIDNCFKINNISLPIGMNISYLDESYIKYEKIGINNINKCGFVLVAGGLGERLNLNSIKV